MDVDPALDLPGQGAAAPGPAPARVIAPPVVARLAELVDLLLLAVSGAAGAAGLPLGRAVLATALFVHAAHAVLRRLAAYRADRLQRPLRAVATAAIAVACSTAWVGLLALLLGAAPADLRFVPLTGALALPLLAAHRAALHRLVGRWRRLGRLTRNVAVVGANQYSRSFIEQVRADPGCGLSIVGVYDDRLNRIGATHAAVPVQGNVRTLLADSRSQRIDVMVVALPLSASARIAEIRGQLSPSVADIFLTADVAGLRYAGSDFESLGRNGVIRVGRRPLGDWDEALKSAFDRVCAGVLLLLLSPVLLAIAVAIRLDSPGPALFRQPRLGFNNRPFRMFKFRSMYTHLTDLHAAQQTVRDDRRVTRLGRVLRRTSLDELPQLLNVLRGDMSLVGPRPHAAHTKAEDRLFDEVVANYALRHRIKPGITGWAQVNGWRGETARIEQIEQRVAHDLSYIENWSLLLDLRILLMTALRGFVGKAAY